MNRYIVRIQLNHAASVDYKLLHDAMDDINFFRYINGNLGNWYNLTTAMYYGAANLSAQQLQKYLDALIERIYVVDNNPPINHEILVVEENAVDYRLFRAKTDDLNIPPLDRYLVAVI